MKRSVPDRDRADDPTRRLDKWLWFARVAKTRTLAASLVAAGRVRVNRIKAVKPSHEVRCGDVLTIITGPQVRILRVVAVGVRRGPPAEAQALYEALSLVRTHDDAPAKPVAEREPGAGRPTKRQRRDIERFTADE
jgi:ribosome-associated heat shock protein Hsp15